MGKEDVIATHTATRTHAASRAVAATEEKDLMWAVAALGGRSAGVAVALIIRWERTVPSDDEAIEYQFREPALVCSVQETPKSVDV